MCIRDRSSYQERISKVKDAWSKTRESSTEELGKNISASRRAEILLLAQTYLNFDANEQNYMNYLSLQQGLRKGKSLLELQTDFESVEKGEDGQWIPIYPNYFIQQERINELWPMGANTAANFLDFIASGRASELAPTGQVQQVAEPTAEAQAPAEVAAPKKEERTIFDLELTAVDPAKKIVAIKEVRQMFNLGLKEAKELIEKAPVFLKKDIKKEEAEAIAEKLRPFGCTLELK
eukprot:TRINITY_DN6073_c0_g1_i5.p1 TRINITY_DN6073_c0_g1~~TRINITY_DN6073_c0_g1_i5.p1  ORF type:complete len:267 (+),score=78.20 TRINITY_DN6073_c0_g1_i5:99-803(+)